MFNLQKCKNPDLGLLLVRLGLGSIFIYHGWLKVQNIAGTTMFFESLGLNVFFVYLVMLVELLGGIAMVLGVLVEYAGWLLAINMLFAILLVKLPKGWAGIEFELILLLSAAAVALSGAGSYALGMKGKK
ncbi:DoxX family protein [Candidatus Uhrbacteria bacterium]|nr:DoxX family protein [Candidatus Uhrbacteria bacterium]